MKNEYYTVYVCFSDPAVRGAFAALLTVEGATVITTDSLEGLTRAFNDDAPLIRAVTENLYAKKLTPSQLKATLVVGDHEELETLTSPTLCRPLTEQKVERAFGELLR